MSELAPEPLPRLSTADLETLLAALDPLLDGFGAGTSCLDDALAYLARLGIAPVEDSGQASPLLAWIERWRSVQGNRHTLRLMVQMLLQERLSAPERR